MVDYLQILEDIVYSLRTTEAITSTLESAGQSTIISPNSLAVNDVVIMQKSYVAGQIRSVSSSDNSDKSEVTFSEKHNLLKGASVTIANATESTYNGIHTDINVISSNKIVINTSYVIEADTSNWTATSDLDYRVISSTSSEFLVAGTNITATEWVSGAPYYKDGTPEELSNTLLEKDKNDKLKYQKYPLVYIVLNIDESGKNYIYDTVLNPLNVVILTKTEMNYTSKERRKNVFQPILHPLYESFMEALEESTLLAESNLVPLLYRDNYFWGTKAARSEGDNVLNDPIDAIEIRIDKLSVFEQCNNKQ